MKRITSLLLTLALALAMALSFTACGTASDFDAVKAKGYFVCGVTVYEPMNYQDENGSWTGFDTEFAMAVANELGVEAKFQVISWPQKYMELNSGSIDLIWNGFTLGLESDGKSRTDYVDFTDAYLENRQCIVTKASRLTELATKESFAGLKGTAEGGSSGQGVAEELAGSADKITTFTSQASALMEVEAGRADFAVIDYQMARAMAGVGDYSALAINTAYEPESEVYAVGCRKGSDLTVKINEAIAKLRENGKLAELARKYGLENDLILEGAEA